MNAKQQLKAPAAARRGVIVPGADILFVEAVTHAEEVRALPQRLQAPQLMNMVD